MAELQTSFTSAASEALCSSSDVETLVAVGGVGWSFLSRSNLSAPKASDVVRHCCKQWFPFKVELMARLSFSCATETWQFAEE